MTAQEELCASEFVGLAKREYTPPMNTPLARRIHELRISLGMNQNEFAERLGVTQGTVSRWEKGALPDALRLSSLAEMADVSIASFIAGGLGEATDDARLTRFWVRGTVAAGVWATAYEWPKAEWVEYSAGSHVKVPAKARYGLRSEGESMNLVYPPGTILDCVEIERAGELRNGQRVIIERVRTDGEVEATVKEYHRGDDGTVWFVPRSTNPAFQTPIAASDPGPDVAEVRIVAVVVGSYRPEP